MPAHEKGRPTSRGAAHPRGFDTSDSTRALLAVVVCRQLLNGGTRTNVYRSLRPAEKALDRAAQAGLEAVVQFVRLVPVETPTADELAALEGGEGR